MQIRGKWVLMLPPLRPGLQVSDHKFDNAASAVDRVKMTCLMIDR